MKNEYPEKRIYKEMLKNSLFSGQEKKKKKIDIIVLGFMFLVSGSLFAQVDFSSNGISSIWLLVSIGLIGLFVSIGYKWITMTERNFKRESIFFWFMIIISLINYPLFYIFKSDKSSFLHIWIFIEILITCIFFHELILFVNNKNTVQHIFKKILGISILSLMLILGAFAGLLAEKVLNISIFIGIVLVVISILIIIMTIYKIILSPKKESLIKINKGIRVILIGMISGSLTLIARVIFESSSIFTLWPIVISIVQIVVASSGIWIMIINKNEFKTGFVKSYVWNMYSLLQLVLVFVSKQLMVQTGIPPNYFLNVTIATIAILSGLIVMFIKNIVRNKIYLILDTLSVILMTMSISALGILTQMDTLSTVGGIGLDELFIFMPLIVIVVNTLISTIKWYNAWSKKEREMIWN